MSNTNPVYNLNAPLVDPKTGKVVPPWNSFFQQFTQDAPAVSSVIKNPFTPNAIGKFIIIGATKLILSRGSVSVDITGMLIVPMSIGDTVIWTGGNAQWWGGV